ncbi:MAG: glycosyltransferase family 2 protein [Simkaniaceae bacterium]|nr:MAG: glycosyltransferase family 2 protein [Simkaniaceae bacterium]
MKRNAREKSLANRLFILFIILLLPTFFIREYRIIKSKKETRILPADNYTHIKLDPIEVKVFTFIVLTHDDESTIERNYDSISTQKYDQYNVIYIDKGSTDGTVELLKRKIGSNKEAQVIECSEDHEAYKKYYEVVSKCPDNQVIVHLYGADWLAHEDVLSLLAQSYSHPDVWLSYGQYLDYWNYQKGLNDPKPKKALCKKRVQRAPWVVAPLKTYYAGLFKKLHIEAGFFLSIEDENALLNPMAELGKAHVRFIPDVLFIHNEKREGDRGGRRLAFMTEKLKGPIEKTFSESIVDLMIFSENSPENLKECLESCKSYLRGIDTIHVIYDCTEATYSSYEKLKKAFQHVHFIRPLDYGETMFKQAVTQALWGNEHGSPYVILSTDQVRIQAPIQLSSCVGAMRKTGAYGFYLHLGKGNENRFMKGVYSWNIRQGEGPFQQPDALQMGLYRRLDLEKDLRELTFNSTNDLINAWADHAPTYRVGLSFEEAKVSTFSSEMLTRS